MLDRHDQKEEDVSKRNGQKDDTGISRIKFALFAFSFQYCFHIPQLMLLRSSRREYLGQPQDEKGLRELIFHA